MGLDSVIANDVRAGDGPHLSRGRKDPLNRLIKAFMNSRGLERSMAAPAHWVSRYFVLSFHHGKLREWCEPLWPNEAACLEKLRSEIDSRVRAVVE